MYGKMREALQAETKTLREASLYKTERVITSPQGPVIHVADPAGGAPREVVNFCANNYLGLADDARLLQAAKEGLDRHGFGMAPVRFICGTHTIHKVLEGALASLLRMEDAILYGSCFDANGGLFETLLTDEDAPRYVPPAPKMICPWSKTLAIYSPTISQT